MRRRTDGTGFRPHPDRGFARLVCWIITSKAKIPVDLELVFAVDSSASEDSREFEL